jgi:hypothetical protein
MHGPMSVKIKEKKKKSLHVSSVKASTLQRTHSLSYEEQVWRQILNAGRSSRKSVHRANVLITEKQKIQSGYYLIT